MMDIVESPTQWGLTVDNRNIIVKKAESKSDGIYSFRGVIFRVKNGQATHFAVDGKILLGIGAANTQVGEYELGRNDKAKAMLKSIKD